MVNDFKEIFFFVYPEKEDAADLNISLHYYTQIKEAKFLVRL
jgi:hypothetical protein